MPLSISGTKGYGYSVQLDSIHTVGREPAKLNACAEQSGFSIGTQLTNYQYYDNIMITHKMREEVDYDYNQAGI